jgi:hypothetical protein
MWLLKKSNRFGNFNLNRNSVLNLPVLPVLNLSIALAAIFLLTHCGSQKNTSTGSGTFTAIYNETLSQSCVECHKPSGSATIANHTTLDFSNGQTAAYNSLIGKTVQGLVSTGTCGTVSLVNTGVPAYSYLLGTLIPSYSNSNFGGAGGCTPYSGHAPLSQQQQDDFIAWINGGAQNN